MGNKTSQDSIRYVKVKQEDVDQGNPQAQYEQGIVYANGKGVKQDLNKAFQSWKLSADQGHSYAQYNLACLYYDGRGVEKDLKKAIQYFKLSADQGNPSAIFIYHKKFKCELS